jgi:RimJ/RimL family protein N-acetyltransferase
MIEGKQVGLRLMESEDVWLLYRWFNDQRVLEDLGTDHGYFCVSMDQEKMAMEKMVQDRKALYFIISKLDGAIPIGVMGLANIDERNASAELRIVIGEASEWGKGLGEEAIGLLLDHAFNAKNLHRVWLRVAEYNVRAIACYRKCGFVEDGRMRHDHYHKAGWRDALLMSILSSEHRGG